LERYEAGPLNRLDPQTAPPRILAPHDPSKVRFTLYLIRHPKVSPEWEGICYGEHDVALESPWQASLEPKLECLRQLTGPDQIAEIWHSDLSRTRQPAEWLGSQLGLSTVGDARLRERHFGSWQGLAWADIPQEEIMNAHDMLDKPNTYRPGNGETTKEMMDRVTGWLEERLAKGSDMLPPIAMIAHSGSITSLCGSILGLAPRDWTPYYLKPSEWLVVSNHNAN
jgi:alpha-ribazole phosphatase